MKHQKYVPNHHAGNTDTTIFDTKVMAVDETAVGMGETTTLGSESVMDDIATQQLVFSIVGESRNEDGGSLTGTALPTMLSDNSNTEKQNKKVSKKGRREVDKDESHYNTSRKDVVIEGKLYKCCRLRLTARRKIKYIQSTSSVTWLWINLTDRSGSRSMRSGNCPPRTRQQLT